MTRESREGGERPRFHAFLWFIVRVCGRGCTYAWAWVCTSLMVIVLRIL